MEYMLCPACHNFVPLKPERSRCPECRTEIAAQNVLGKPALESAVFEGAVPDAQQRARLSEGLWAQQKASGVEKAQIDKLKRYKTLAWISLPLSILVMGGLYALILHYFGAIDDAIMTIPLGAIRVLCYLTLFSTPLFFVIGSYSLIKMLYKHAKAITVADARCAKPEECLERLLYGTGLLAGQQCMDSPLDVRIPRKNAAAYAASLAMRMVPDDLAANYDIGKLTATYSALYGVAQDMEKRARSHFIGVAARDMAGNSSTVEKATSVPAYNARPFETPVFETEPLEPNAVQVTMTCPGVPVRGQFTRYDKDLQISVPEGSILLSRFELKVKAVCIRRGDNWFLYDLTLGAAR